MNILRMAFASVALASLAACGSGLKTSVSQMQQIPMKVPVPEAKPVVKKVKRNAGSGEAEPVMGPQTQDPWPQHILTNKLAMSHCRTVTIFAQVPGEGIDLPVARAPYRTILAEAPRTREEVARGMKGRAMPPADTAMVFEFRGDHNPAMWMKDTPAPLDMIFVTAEGHVFYMEERTKPFSELFLSPDDAKPVAKYVLEVPAGRASQFDIVPGASRLRFGDVAPCKSFYGGADMIAAASEKHLQTAG